MKLLAGKNQELMQIIPILLGCKEENLTEENFINMTAVGEIIELMKETAYSHLMEVRNISFCFIVVVHFVYYIRNYYSF